MRLGVILAALAGLAGAAYLIFYVGFDDVLHGVLSVGWGGFGLLWLYGAANSALLGVAWFLLVPPYSARSAVTFSWGRAVRDAAGDVLPFSQLGGMVIGARAAMLRGLSPGQAFGSTVVDITIEMVSQIAFVLVGLAILVLDLPSRSQHMELMEGAIAAILVAILAAGGFVVVQRRGFALLEGVAERFLPKAAAHAGEIDRVINAIHGNPGRMVVAFAIHFVGWMSSAFGTWVALELIGSPAPFTATIAIESLLTVARSAAVFVPGAIGVQEAGYAVMMPLFGLTPEIGLAVSLLKRAREVAVGAPVLLSWQVAEGGHAAAVEPAKPLQEIK